MSEPLPEDVVAALNRIAGVGRLLIALDFDGTLAPFVADPLKARMLPQAASAIDRLQALPDTEVAFVSGRPLELLASLTESTDDTLLVASHGVELRLGANEQLVQLDAAERALLDELDERLSEIAGRHPPVRLERKPAGRGIHTRRADPAVARQALLEARDYADTLGPEVTVRGGNNVMEFAVRGATKGDGIRTLRESTHADAVLFAGDDVTDEDGFLALREGDVGLKVGEGATAAGYRVADPNAVADALSLLADRRAAR